MTRAIFPDTSEDTLKEDFFRGTDRGFFVDVGAYEPVEKSQSFEFEQRGWNGVLIEPQPAIAARLRKHRKAPVYAVACSSPANTGKVMPLHVAGGMHASLETDYYVAGYQGRPLEMVDVPIKTVDEILRETGAPIPVDFVSIDTEFHELDVLSGFDIGYWRPRLILIEDIHADLRIHRYLRRRRYKWMRRTGFNSWYVPEETPTSLTLFGRWQFVRKHVLGVPFRRLRDAKRKWRGQ